MIFFLKRMHEAVVGRNGAGKSTMMSLLAGELQPCTLKDCLETKLLPIAKETCAGVCQMCSLGKKLKSQRRKPSRLKLIVQLMCRKASSLESRRLSPKSVLQNQSFKIMEFAENSFSDEVGSQRPIVIG